MTGLHVSRKRVREDANIRPYHPTVFFVAIGLLLFGVGQSRAADLPFPPRTTLQPYVYTWTGMYLGADVGYQQTQQSASVTQGNSSTSVSQTANGFIVAVHGGYNWQIPSLLYDSDLVVGLEADVGGFSKTATSTTAIGAEVFTATGENPWLSSFRMRLGVPLGAAGLLLPYLTAGAAFGEFKSTLSFTGPAAGWISGTSDRAAWIVGGGLEYAVNREWSLRVEYLYFDTETFKDVAPAIAGTTLSIQRFTGSLLRSGISFHF